MLIFFNEIFAGEKVYCPADKTHVDLISRTNDIYLAKLINKYEPIEKRKLKLKMISENTPEKSSVEELLNEVNRTNSVVYEFSVSSTLKGGNEDNLLIKLEKDSFDEQHISHDHNSDFWENSYIGRNNINKNCWVNPSFELDKTYLLFVDGLDHPKGAELISSLEDKWYVFVKKNIAKVK